VSAVRACAFAIRTLNSPQNAIYLRARASYCRRGSRAAPED
jgi:hypothetical protein